MADDGGGPAGRRRGGAFGAAFLPEVAELMSVDMVQTAHRHRGQRGGARCRWWYWGWYLGARDARLRLSHRIGWCQKSMLRASAGKASLASDKCCGRHASGSNRMLFRMLTEVAFATTHLSTVKANTYAHRRLHLTCCQRKQLLAPDHLSPHKLSRAHRAAPRSA